MTNLNVAANWVHTFDPTSIMQVSFATTDIKRETGNAFVGLPDGFISTVGWNPDFAGGFRGGTSYVPNVGVAQYFGGGERIGCTRTSDTWQYKGTYTKIVGTHTLKFGAEYNVIGHLGRTDDHANGFSTVGTASPDNPGGTGHPLASFLLNVPNRWSRRDFHKRARGGAMFSFFGQDSWKVTPRLTIDFGMRVDRTVLPQFGNPEENTVEFGNIDFSFFKIFSINERLRVEYRAEFFNGTNTPQYAAPSSNISRGNFGRVLRTANRARQIQMGLKLYF